MRGDRCLGVGAVVIWGGRLTFMGQQTGIPSPGCLANVLVLVRPGFEFQIHHRLAVTLDVARLQPPSV